MRKIYLTININCQDDNFQFLDGVKKLNVGDIVKSKQLLFNPNDLQINRGNLVVETILKNRGDLLIGYAIQQSGPLDGIVHQLEYHGIFISKVFYDNKRRETELIRYKEKYNLHSNWMDYSPDFIELKYKEFDNILEDIKIESRACNVKMEAI